MYTITLFSKLIETYPTFEELRSFLTSLNGGNMRIIESDEYKDYAIIRYVRGNSFLYKNEADRLYQEELVPWLRSVVWNKVTNRPVCLGPRKGLETEYVESEISAIEEFVEGVMVNGFLDKDNTLTFATRSSLGAKKGYYTEKSFGQMMDEAMKRMNLKKEAVAQSMTESGFQFCSFVLQHPEHKMVTKCTTPSVYVVHLGKVEANGDIVMTEEYHEWPLGFEYLKMSCFEALKSGETLESRLEKLKTICPKGVVCRTSNGRSYHLSWFDYDTKYKWIRSSKPEENFVNVRFEGKMKEFLKLWPEYRNQFYTFETQYRQHTKRIYEEYCKVHKEHSKKFQDVPEIYQRFVFSIHGIYLEHYRPEKKTIKMADVIGIVNSRCPEYQVYLVSQKV